MKPRVIRMRGRSWLAATMLLGVGLFSAAAFAAASPVLVSQWPAGNRGPVQAVQVNSNLAYCAIGEGGLAILDVSNPAKPSWVGDCDTPGLAVDIALDSEHYAFVADSSAGLRVFDLNGGPAMVGSYTNCDVVKGVVAAGIGAGGYYAFLADGTNGLQVINVGTPSAPVRVGGCALTNGFAEGVAVSGNYAYVAMGSAGLLVVDVADPYNPARKGLHDTTGYAKAVAVSGNYAYVADGNWGLQVIDVSNPTNLVRAGGLDTSGYAQGVAVSGNYAYVADSDAGLQVLDVSDPANPVLRGSWLTGDWATKLGMAGTLACVAAGANLEIIDVAVPASPAPAGAYNTGGDFVSVATAGTNAYVADSLGGVHVLDFSNPTNVSSIAQVSNWTFGLTLSGNYGYAAGEGAGLQVFDLRNAASPVPVGYYDSTGYAYGAAILGPYVCLADGASGLQVLDMSNPANPVRVGGYDTSGFAYGVAVAGTYAYVADGASGLQVIDLANPSAPARIAVYNTTGGRAESVAVAGNYTYVAAYSAGLQVIDVSDPAHPRRVGTYSSSTNACGVVLAGNYAYVADGIKGLEVFDISNPINLVPAGSYDSSGFAEKVSVAGNYVCLADGPAGVAVIQVYGLPGDAPRLVQSPQSQTVVANAAVLLSVSAQGEEPLYYQWRFNGVDLPGATQSSLALPNVTESQTGAYCVVVSNLNGSVISGPVIPALARAPQFELAGTNGPAMSGNQFRCSLSTQPGVTYAIEYKTTWPSNWQFLQTVAGDGHPVNISDPDALGPCRFYRARVLNSPAILELLRAPQFDLGGTNGPAMSGNRFRCGLSTQPGVTYAIEYKTAWSSNWQFLRIVAGDGSSVPVSDPSATTPCRFYRARVL